MCDEAFTGSNAVNYVHLGRDYKTLGDGFTASDGGVVCNFTGVALVSFSFYVRTTAEGTCQLYINVNGTDITSVGYNTGVAGQCTMAQFPLSVNNGDVIKVMGRTWGSYTFTLSANGMNWMTVQKVISYS